MCSFSLTTYMDLWLLCLIFKYNAIRNNVVICGYHKKSARYLYAMHSISTKAPLGKDLTATALRAGKGAEKN